MHAGINPAKESILQPGVHMVLVTAGAVSRRLSIKTVCDRDTLLADLPARGKRASVRVPGRLRGDGARELQE